MSQQLTERPASGTPTHRPEGTPPWAHLRPTNTKAVLAVSLLSFPPAAIVFGVLARREIRRTGEGGWGLATWGMGLGIAAVALAVLYVVALVALYVMLVGVAIFSMDSGLYEPTTGL